MNIFVLDTDPILAAQAQHDKHVVKMVLETAQMLSTVVHEQNPSAASPLYRPTHRNHPCTRWAAQHPDNIAWLVDHGCALASEYQHRFNRTHASLRVILQAAEALGCNASSLPATPFAQAMPDEYKHPDAVTAYRAYYRATKINDKTKWTNRARPAWL